LDKLGNDSEKLDGFRKLSINYIKLLIRVKA
jgi:hypothetical protein